MSNLCAFAREALLSLVLALAVCATAAAAPESLQPAGWDELLKLAEATDRNPDPGIVEIDLEARVASLEIAPGAKTEVWTYNGSLPGPLIRVRRGDRLIVHFSNKLQQPTTVHWHGVQVPIEMDGVPGVSQAPVETGGSFTYDFVVPDAGLFWYHPHVMSAAQVGFGLYGPLLVEDPEDPVKLGDQLVLVLSDIAIEERDGKLQSPDSGGVLGALFGREGNHVLVNGRKRPRIPIRSGAMQRWRIVNAAKSRYFQLQFDEPQPFHLIGVDGGYMEYSVERHVLVLAPGERVDVIVAPRLKEGQTLTLISVPYDRGFGSVEFRSAEDLIAFEAAPLPAAKAAPFPKVTRDIPALSGGGARSVKIELVTSTAHGITQFDIKGGPFWRDTSIAAELGEMQLWTITNKAIWAHPIHLHGFFFQEVDEKGVPVTPRAWKDTIHVPAESTRRFLVKLDRPGSWMYHCHILDHAEAGLMSTVDVGTAKSSSGGHTHDH
jgi:FtsP/CotA-like multicopper oxidase with cupredoxin domain